MFMLESSNGINKMDFHTKSTANFVRKSLCEFISFHRKILYRISFALRKSSNDNIIIAVTLQRKKKKFNLLKPQIENFYPIGSLLLCRENFFVPFLRLLSLAMFAQNDTKKTSSMERSIRLNSRGEILNNAFNLLFNFHEHRSSSTCLNFAM